MIKPPVYTAFSLLFLLVFQVGQAQNDNGPKTLINGQLEAWHQAAADADFDAYFNLMTKNAVFVGTDAEENWQHDAFKAFSKPYFDRGKAWDFTTLERHIYLGENQKTAWFDELLDTWMGIARGSGVLELNGGNWKVAHYVLSVTVPNENVEAVIKMKKEHDDDLIKKLNQETEYNNVTNHNNNK